MESSFHSPEHPDGEIKRIYESVLSDQGEIDDAIAASLTDSMKQIIDLLPPTARTVFLLHDAFKMPYSEIADVLKLREDTVQRIGQWARQRIERRMHLDPPLQ